VIVAVNLPALSSGSRKHSVGNKASKQEGAEGITPGLSWLCVVAWWWWMALQGLVSCVAQVPGTPQFCMFNKPLWFSLGF